MTRARVLARERSAGDPDDRPDDARDDQRDDDAAAQHEECDRRGGEHGELPAFAQWGLPSIGAEVRPLG